MATQVQSYAGIQRPLRGSRISTFYPVKSLPALSSLDSAFQLQEYISLLIRLDVHDVETITSLPGLNRDVNKEENEVDKDNTSAFGSSYTEKGGDEKDVTVDEACWIYEQLRRLAQDLTHPLITTLQQECSRNTCPEMKAGEWLYLCVAHGAEGAMEQCCAIDYILHTLDSATALLNSPRAFPSRLQIPTASHRHFSSLARRLGRIFAHAYFHHREAFEQAEAESSLYARFLTLTSKFDLVPTEFLVIPTGSHVPGSEIDEEGGDEGVGTSGSGFGLREVKLGTSYDPRRGQGMGGHHQLPSSYQDEFPDVPRARRLPQQYQQYHNIHQSSPIHLHQSGHHQPLHVYQESPTSGTESPKKTGRNRTHTMVLSEAAGIADDLARAIASSRAEEEREKERMRKEAEERDARAREEAEKDEREKVEAAAEAQAQARRETEEADEQDVSEVKEAEAEAEPTGSIGAQQQIKLAEENSPVEETEEKTTTTATPDSKDPTTNPAHEPSSKQTTEVDIAEGDSSTVTATTEENHTVDDDDDDDDEASIREEVEEISIGGLEIETEAPIENVERDSGEGGGQTGTEKEDVNTKDDDGAVPENETRSESQISEKSEQAT